MTGIVGTAKILVIDDEIAIADTFALILLKRGYEARVAYSAEGAIDILADWKPDLAIIDVVLPMMNGFEFATVLNENYPDCRILFISGQPGSGLLLEEANQKGQTFQILPKPIHPDIVLSAVSGLLSRDPQRPAEA